MFEIKTYELGYCSEDEYTRVVCVCRFKDKFLFSYKCNYYINQLIKNEEIYYYYFDYLPLIYM